MLCIELDVQKSIDFSVHKIRSQMDDPKMLRYALICLLGNLESYQSNKLPFSAEQMLEKETYRDVISILLKYKTDSDFINQCTKILCILAIHCNEKNIIKYSQC